MESERREGQPRETADPSDLIGVEFTAVVAVALLVVLAAFFFVSPVVGVLILLALGGLAAYAITRVS